MQRTDALTSAASLDHLLAVPGNRPVFDALQQLLGEERAIAFVGAGAAAGMYPLWPQLIGQLADYAVDQGKAEARDRDRWKADRASTSQQRVSTIVRRLGEDHYRQFLRDTFQARRGSDGKRYTPTHAALLRLPFRGYVTTNYDPALDFARSELRPDCLTTGTPTWQDDDEVHRWLTGDALAEAEGCPILWLHGYWQRPAGIVLNAGEYATAYKPGLYRKTFERLWEQDHLIFVGFGFNDPQFTFMMGEILRDIAGAHALPRHVAILGLKLDEEGNPPDAESIKEARANLEADYHVRPLIYRVQPRSDGGGEDHSELLVLLEGLTAARGSRPPTPSPAAATAHGATPALLPARWVHETTDDDKFTGRDDELVHLDRWVGDPAVRAIGVCAVGGTGKTALIGHWLKNTNGWRRRPFAGLFAWSFYQNRATDEFLRGLLLWAHETFSTPRPDDRTDLVPAALNLLRTRALAIVLDGLEVLQEGTEESSHGAFLDGMLREFLGGLCTQQHESLAVLTSRFVFADLERHLGTAFHQRELGGLTPEQGAALLAQLDVRGSEADRRHVSLSLDGHPLGLRVFAEAIPDARRDQPRAFLDQAFRAGRISADSPLAGKLQRLLVFYERRLPSAQVRLLGVVALFRAPVAEATILRLVRGLHGQNRKDPLPDDAALVGELRRMHARGILSYEPTEDGHGYACHPILRDHFRGVLLRGGRATAQRAADLLKGQPSSQSPRSVREIESVLLAIEVLLDAGKFKEADELYLQRLENGQVFLKIPANAEGVRCALGFVQDGTRRRQCEKQLSTRRLAFYLNDVGLAASNNGQLELAGRFYADSIAIRRKVGDARDVSIGLQNQAALAVYRGRLAEAADRQTESLGIARGARIEGSMKYGYAYRGWTQELSGQVRAAAEDFATANGLEKKATGQELYSLRGTQWAELLYRAGHAALGARRAAANLRVCERNRWNDDSARCHFMLGACALTEGQLDEAEAELRQAEGVFHGGQLLFWLARLHVTAGQVALARRDPAGALHRAAEALALAQPRGMRLVHADTLVLRGRARLLETELSGAGAAPGLTDRLARALDDAEDALRLASDCGYAWAERDALLLQSDTHAALAAAHEDAGKSSVASRHHDAAYRAHSAAEALSARLTLTAEDLAEADAKASAWLSEWEATGKKGNVDG